MSTNERFEVRCSPEIRELAEAIGALEGHPTFSAMVRVTLIEHARRRVLLDRTGEQTRRLKGILKRIAEGAD